MRRRKRLVTLTVGALSMAALALAVSAATSAGTARRSAPAHKRATQTTRVVHYSTKVVRTHQVIPRSNLTDADLNALGAFSATGQIDVIAQSSDMRFMTIKAPSGVTCFATGRTQKAGVIGVLHCPVAGVSSPTANQTLDDHSVWVGNDSGLKLSEFAGFAAASVVSVEIVQSNGASVVTPVVNGVYEGPTGISGVAAIKALAADGTVVGTAYVPQVPTHRS